MIRSRLNTEEDLRLTRSQLEVILENVADAVTAQDATGKMIYANKVAAITSGYSTIEEMLSAPHLDYLEKFKIENEDGSTFNIADLPGRRALAGEKNPKVLLKITIKATGEVRFLNVKSTAIYTTDKKPYLVINTMQDVTERKMAEQEKSDFLSMASHELKTPLTSIKLFMDLLEKETQKKSYSKKLGLMIDKIHNQTNRLIKLTNDLLDISRIETGKLRLKVEQFRLDLLIEDSISEIRQTAADARITFNNKSEVSVHADKFRINQVLFNLLNNTIKYSPKGGEIIVSINKTDSDFIISVQDFGVGIKKHLQEKIFERLYQVSDLQEKTYPGLGMGLFISKEIVERHNGKIWVESKFGQGSIFYFSLPIGK